MNTTAIFPTALTAAGLVLLLWIIGRAVTAAGNRIPPAQGRSRHYLAGRLDGVQITTIIDYGDELLVSLATQDAPLAGVFRITASTCSLTRVRRWHDERTPLRAYLSHDGAIMLADPALGGNAPCEPPITETATRHARDETAPGITHQPRTNDLRAAKRPVRERPQRRAPVLGGDKDQGPCGSRPGGIVSRPAGATPHGTRGGPAGS